MLVVPGRNPVVLAKELASLDRLSGGRLLPGVGLGARCRPSTGRSGSTTARAGLFDEAVGLMRRLWTEDDVHHDGEHFHVDGVTLRPRPVQQPIDVWLGGTSPSELRRTGRLGDGWLPSFTVPAEVEDGWATITKVAAEHDRAIDPEHLGVLVLYTRGELPDAIAAGGGVPPAGPRSPRGRARGHRRPAPPARAVHRGGGVEVRGGAAGRPRRLGRRAGRAGRTTLKPLET